MALPNRTDQAGVWPLRWGSIDPQALRERPGGAKISHARSLARFLCYLACKVCALNAMDAQQNFATIARGKAVTRP